MRRVSAVIYSSKNILKVTEFVPGLEAQKVLKLPSELSY